MMRWLTGRRAPRSNTTQPGRCLLEGQEIAYTLHGMVRRRRITLVVDHDGAVAVRGPWGTTLQEAERLLVQHGAWVLAQVQRLRSAPRPEKVWAEGEGIPFLDQVLRLRFTHTGSTRQVGEELRLPVSEREAGTVEAALERWYRRRAVAHFRERLDHWSGRMGIGYTRLVVRGQKTRWGSCSGNGTISLNWRLMQRGAELVDYVVIHELAHRRHMNHEADFWALVARHDPDYARHRALLRTPRRVDDPVQED